MTMLALYREPDRRELRRWSLAALVIVALHVVSVIGITSWYRTFSPPGTTIPTILVDLSPVSAAPETRTEDSERAPGPQMEQAEAPAQPPPEPQVEETLAPTPPQENPVVAAPPEQKPKPVTEPPKPVPVREKPKKQPEKRAAPVTTAPPRAERAAPAQRAAAGASAAAATATYNAMVRAHMQRFMRPAGAETGSATISIIVGRNGQMISSSVSRSSGRPAIDAEALAVARRAQPLPAFLPGMTETSIRFIVPVNFRQAR